VAICKTCGTKYSKWTTPVSAKGVCAACFETELSKERNADAEPQENVLAPISPVTEVERRITPIRLSSFIPRTRSKVVFALVMACYSLPSDASCRHGRMSRMSEAHLERSIFVAVHPTLFRFSSLPRSSNRSFWLACLNSCAERVLLQLFKYSSLHYSLARCTSGRGGRTR